VSEEDTQNLNAGRSFEERVFARFDSIDDRFDAVDAKFVAIDARFAAIDARFDAVDARFDAVDARFNTVDSAIRNLDSRIETLETRADETNTRLEKLEVRAYDTKPIWEQALKEIIEMRREAVETKREFSKRLAKIEAVIYETRSDLRDVEDRVDKLEQLCPKSRLGAARGVASFSFSPGFNRVTAISLIFL
jgi:chromosome segregation ATPase